MVQIHYRYRITGGEKTDDKKTITYDKRFYLDEFVERGVVRLFELFADVEEVDLTPGHHDANECPVIGAQALGKGGEIQTTREKKTQNMTQSQYQILEQIQSQHTILKEIQSQHQILEQIHI